MQQHDIAERDAVRAEQESEARAERAAELSCPVRTAHLPHGTCAGITLAEHPERP